MKDFLEKLPPLLAALSKAFFVALIAQIREVANAIWSLFTFLGRLILRSAKWLWKTYCRVESQILRVVVDLGLAILALRYLFLFLAIGIVLAHFKLWILLTVYVLLLSIAIYWFFHIDSETVRQEEQYHKQSCDTS